MEMHSNLMKGVCRTQLSGELTINHALELKPKLLHDLERCTEMQLHLGGVSEVDTAGLQLLVLLKREAQRHNKTLRLIDHSPAVVEFLDLFDLAGHFGDPILISSQQRGIA